MLKQKQKELFKHIRITKNLYHPKEYMLKVRILRISYLFLQQ